MRRFHLLSFLLAMIVAGGLLGLSFRGDWRPRDDQLPYIVEYGLYEYGWPQKCASYEGMVFLIAPNEEPLSVEEMHKRAFFLEIKNPHWVTRTERGILTVGPDICFQWRFLVIDALVFLTAAAVALYGVEYFLHRRRDARSKPEVSI